MEWGQWAEEGRRVVPGLGGQELDIMLISGDAEVGKLTEERLLLVALSNQEGHVEEWHVRLLQRQRRC